MPSSCLKRKNSSEESDAATANCAEGSNRQAKRVRFENIDSTESVVPSLPLATPPATSTANVASTRVRSVEEMQRDMERMGERLARLEQDNRIKTAALERVNETIQCGICKDVMKNPQTLQCGHSACYRCLRKWFTTATSFITEHSVYISTDEEGSDNDSNQPGPSYAPYPHPHARLRHRFHSVTHRPKLCPTCRTDITCRPTTSYALREMADAIRPTPLSVEARTTRDRRWTRRADMWRGIFPSESGHVEEKVEGGGGGVAADPILENFARAQAWSGRSSALPRREREIIRPRPYNNTAYRRDRVAGHAPIDEREPRERVRHWLMGGTTADSSAESDEGELQNQRHRQRQRQRRRGRVPLIPSPLCPPVHTDEFHSGSPTTLAPAHPPVFIIPPPSAPQPPLPDSSSLRSSAIAQPAPSSSTHPSSSSQQASSSSLRAPPITTSPSHTHTEIHTNDVSISTILGWLRTFHQRYTSSSSNDNDNDNDNNPDSAEADGIDEDEATDLALIDAMLHGTNNTSTSDPQDGSSSRLSNGQGDREYPVYVEELETVPEVPANDLLVDDTEIDVPHRIDLTSQRPQEEDEDGEERLRRLEMFGDMAHDPGADSDVVVLVGVEVEVELEAAADLAD